MSTNLCNSDSTHLHVMLGQLQCPFQVEDDQVLCSFYQREDFCPFSHRSDHSPGTIIPPYICVDHLVGKCMADCTWDVLIPDGWLARCPVGYHPTWIQMTDLDLLDRNVIAWGQHLQDQVQVHEDLKCAICLEQMHSPFGLLEHCRHVFCGECIILWKETDHHKSCPVCRVASRRLLLWSNPISNEQLKLQLFGLQARSIELFHRPNQPGADQRDQVQVDDHQKCAICSQRMHSPLGLLERCCHIFCAQCIVVWQETDPQMCCPVCRVHSRRVLLWSNAEPIKNEQDKLELFHMQDRCIFLYFGMDRELAQQAQGQDELVQPLIITWQEMEQMNRQIAILRERGVPLPWEMD